jgi:hypothetical protein
MGIQYGLFWYNYKPRVRYLQDGMLHKDITHGLVNVHKRKFALHFIEFHSVNLILLYWAKAQKRGDAGRNRGIIYVGGHENAEMLDLR